MGGREVGDRAHLRETLDGALVLAVPGVLLSLRFQLQDLAPAGGVFEAPHEERFSAPQSLRERFDRADQVEHPRNEAGHERKRTRNVVSSTGLFTFERGVTFLVMPRRMEWWGGGLSQPNTILVSRPGVSHCRVACVAQGACTMQRERGRGAGEGKLVSCRRHLPWELACPKGLTASSQAETARDDKRELRDGRWRYRTRLSKTLPSRPLQQLPPTPPHPSSPIPCPPCPAFITLLHRQPASFSLRFQPRATEESWNRSSSPATTSCPSIRRRLACFLEERRRVACRVSPEACLGEGTSRS